MRDREGCGAPHGSSTRSEPVAETPRADVRSNVLGGSWAATKEDGNVGVGWATGRANGVCLMDGRAGNDGLTSVHLVPNCSAHTLWMHKVAEECWRPAGRHLIAGSLIADAEGRGGSGP